MKEIILNYTQYNLWANRLITEVLMRVPDEQAKQTMGGSFSSLQKTAEHIWVAECIWLQRLHMVEQVMVPPQESHGEMASVCSQWLQCSEGLSNFASEILDDRGLEHTFHYYNMAGEHQKSTVWECLGMFASRMQSQYLSSRTISDLASSIGPIKNSVNRFDYVLSEEVKKIYFSMHTVTLC